MNKTIFALLFVLSIAILVTLSNALFVFSATLSTFQTLALLLAYVLNGANLFYLVTILDGKKI